MISESTGVAAARAALLQPLMLLCLGLVAWPDRCGKVRTLLEIARTPDHFARPRGGHAAGYYVELIGGGDEARGSPSDPPAWLNGKPDGWIGIGEAGVVHYLDHDFLQFELKPQVRRTLFGQPFVTNAFGMHDDPVTMEKPDGTFRIAVLGASMDMGWGVQYQDTYVNRFQEWLDARADRVGLPLPRRFEVLNFAVAAYSPLQRLDTLRRKVLEFRPDLVIYSATTLDIRLMEIHLCDMLRKGVDLRYDFLRAAVAEAGIVVEDCRRLPKDRLKAMLKPSYWGLYDRALGMIAAECRSADIPLVMVIIPRVGKADAPDVRAVPVARLKALAARHALTVFDLSDTFDAVDPATLEIAACDDHPNAMGHHRLFLALAHAVLEDPPMNHLLFPTGDRPTISDPDGAGSSSPPGGNSGPLPAGSEQSVAGRIWPP